MWPYRMLIEWAEVLFRIIHIFQFWWMWDNVGWFTLGKMIFTINGHGCCISLCFKFSFFVYLILIVSLYLFLSGTIFLLLFLFIVVCSFWRFILNMTTRTDQNMRTSSLLIWYFPKKSDILIRWVVYMASGGQ